jgi:hypothetical protein
VETHIVEEGGHGGLIMPLCVTPLDGDRAKQEGEALVLNLIRRSLGTAGARPAVQQQEAHA